MQTVEEYQAWDVLTGSLGQIKFSPAGHVIGLDLHTCFAVAETRGYDLQCVSELLQDVCHAQNGAKIRQKTPL